MLRIAPDAAGRLPATVVVATVSRTGVEGQRTPLEVASVPL